MSVSIYGAIALTGGGTGALDAIDGAGLLDKDIAIANIQGDGVYFYILDDDAAGSESSPGKITPDANAGNKRWILHEYFPQNIADTTLSGTPVVLCRIGLDGIPYYFKAYPTKV